VRGGYAPMVAAAGRFFGSGEGAADDDGVGTTSERFADLAAFAGVDPILIGQFFELSRGLGS
jgi:hypothetical protein